MRPNAFSIKHVVRQLEASLTAKERRVKRRFRSFKLSLGYHPLTLKIPIVILLTLCHTTVTMLPQRFLALDQLSHRLIFFLYSHPLCA